MTLAELRGGVIMRLGPREKIPLGGVDIEIHNAVDDIRAAAKLATSERLDKIAYLDTSSGKDIYDYPEGAETIRDVFYLGYGPTAIPMTEVSFREQWLVDWGGISGCIMPYSWTELPERRFRIMNRGVTNKQNNLLVRFFPNAKRMIKATDEPNLPANVHENIIPHATLRMASYEGIGLSHPDKFSAYYRMMDDRLAVFLQPDSVSGGGNHIVDMDDIYVGGE